MLVGRVTKLILVALLAIGLGGGVSVSDTQPFAGTSQATLSAAPNSGDCAACKDCAKPCVASITCGAACVSSSLVSASQIAALRANRLSPTSKPGWQLSTAELRTRTPPPKLIHIA
jgi:hypothetical protein